MVQSWRRRVINKIHSSHVSIYQNTLFKFKNLAKRFWWKTVLAGVWFWNLPLYFKYEIKLFDRFFSTLSIFFSYALRSSTCFLSHFVRKGMFGNSVLYFSSSLCQQFFFAYPSCINGSPKPLLTELLRGKLNILFQI